MMIMMMMTMMIIMCFLHPKGYQTQLAPGEGPINYDDDDDNDNDDNDDDYEALCQTRTIQHRRRLTDRLKWPGELWKFWLSSLLHLRGRAHAL